MLLVHGGDRGFVKSTVSTVGQAFTWFGIYELTMTWCPDMVPGPTPEDPQCDPGPSQNAWKPVAMLFIGLSLFFVRTRATNACHSLIARA